MRVSIIVPVHNSAVTLRDCMESLLAQSHLDIEILLIENGSADESPVICEDYASQDDRVTVVHLSTPGVSQARNEGLRIASGQIVMFCDSDDWVDNNWVELMHDCAAATGHALLVSGYRHIVDGTARPPILPTSNHVHLLPEDFYLLEIWGLLNSVVTKAYRTDLIREQNVRFDEALSNGEDLLFNLSFLRFTETVGVVCAAPYYYRRAGHGTLSTTYRTNAWDTAIRLRGEVRALLDRTPGAWSKYQDDFWDVYLSIAERVLHEQSAAYGMRHLQPLLRENNRILRSPEAIQVLERADWRGRSATYRMAFTSGNYLWVLLYRSLVNTVKHLLSTRLSRGLFFTGAPTRGGSGIPMLCDLIAWTLARLPRFTRKAESTRPFHDLGRCHDHDC